jgi:cytochrome c-type biogenesis protein CcmF
VEFYRGAKVIRSRGGGNIFASAIQLTLRNTRRYGGYVVHFGIVLVFIGISGQAFNQDKQMEMSPGSQMQIGRYTLMCQAIDSIPEANYTSERVSIEVLKDGRETMMLYPEKRNYGDSQETGTMVAISSTPREDLYVVYAGTSPQSGKPVIHAYLNPLVKWVWFGGIVVVIGTIIALIPDRAPVMVMQAATQPAAGIANASGARAMPAAVHLSKRQVDGQD